VQGSPPFSLSADDWKKIGIGAVLSMLGALATFIGVELLPTLKENVADDLGLLLYTLLAAAAPVVLNVARKWIGDNTPPLKLLVMAAVFVFASCGTASAEFQGATAAVIDGSLLTKLMADPLLMAAIMPGISLLTSKVFKIDLSKFILPLITSLLKPPGPAVPPVVVTDPATPAPQPNALLQMLLTMLLQAKSSGDKEQEAAALKLLERFKSN
jgi:hypothetical protein